MDFALTDDQSTVRDLAATLLRFVLLRRWVFRQHRTPADVSIPALAITEGDPR